LLIARLPLLADGLPEPEVALLVLLVLLTEVVLVLVLAWVLPELLLRVLPLALTAVPPLAACAPLLVLVGVMFVVVLLVLELPEATVLPEATFLLPLFADGLLAPVVLAELLLVLVLLLVLLLLLLLLREVVVVLPLALLPEFTTLPDLVLLAVVPVVVELPGTATAAATPTFVLVGVFCASAAPALRARTAQVANRSCFIRSFPLSFPAPAAVATTCLHALTGNPSRAQPAARSSFPDLHADP
jgi:hypothetical protein